MSHTQKDQKKLLARVRRINGQTACPHRRRRVSEGVAAGGAINGLMSELLEGHIREHLMNPHASEQERNADMEQIVAVVRSYMK
ncbi:transcriptional repressor RcnR [Klebsiella variicola]|uniref:metal/formaldehyde-sensitive transcriptional repressor n=1 Tax=Klebsiella variicola TaxID=244366 RepID=UPI000E2AA647|nr:metal/formaldehyde-sensitive transcriptional repressor [Klebsiella variicola]SXG02977.1 transcriptional repressor RcnR [Klebsiella variicola]HBR2685163.1 metal/formaldehyde-sensitive transcriptional repressor [Klebsiella pneumoniae]HBW3323699.1 metal/formaldehyde-sensitive transcriptional repressor [Klebsiella pneumoniae]HDZ2384431.1 metal/formaldehyde-sensitive transcriptional repressor [Klebsiella pneumoniae]